MNLRTKLLTAGWLAAALILARPAMATPHFTLNPTSGNQTVGQNFTVAIGVDSDTERVVGIDIKATYDNTKLDIVSVQKATSIPADGYQFTYADGQTIIHSDTGMFEVTLSPISQSVLTGPIAKHELLLVTFRPKATGVATLNFTCLPGSVVETNIISPNGIDVVDCNANQSGSYTIAAGTGGAVVTTAPTPTTASSSGGNNSGVVSTATPVPANSSLPQTAGFSGIWLILMGVMSVGAAFYLKMV